VGGKNYAGEIKFSLTDVSGRTRHLVKRDPAYVAGSLGPYIVTIPEGGTFELPSIDLVDYWSYELKIAVLALPAGRYSLILQLKCAPPTFIYDLPRVNRSPARIRRGIGHVSSCGRDDVARALPSVLPNIRANCSPKATYW
jgi:hypothetical protein